MSNVVKIAVNENVVLAPGTGINDKGYFSIAFCKKQPALDFMDAIGAGQQITPEVTNVSVFGLNATDYKGAPLSVADIGKNINDLNDKLKAILRVYCTDEVINKAFTKEAIFSGTGLNNQNIATNLCNEDVLKLISNNIFNIFTNEATKYEDGEPFRILLTRQNANKHYPSLPTLGRGRVYVEPMTVPVEATKVSFSDWELKNGRDSDKPISTDKPKEEDTSAAANAFGDGDANPFETPSTEEDTDMEFPTATTAAPAAEEEGDEFPM